MQACEAAVRDYPGVARFKFQYARVLFKAGNYEKALRFYREVAEQGHVIAQYTLGNMYENGRGVAQDYAEAVKWYKKAAEQGNAYAQNNLGLSYANGTGVAQDYGEAVTWFRKALMAFEDA